MLLYVVQSASSYRILIKREKKKVKVKAVTFLPNYKILCLELRFVFGKRRKQFVSLPRPPGKNKIK